MPPIREFFADLDGVWQPPPERLRLHIIGSTALMLQTSYERGTRDSDVLETDVLDAVMRARLLALAGPTTDIHTRHHIYLDIVLQGVPFLPQIPTWHPVGSLGELVHFEVVVLDVTDVAVSKLKRFIARDVDDIRAMIDLDAIPHELFVARFRDAINAFSMDARADDLPKFVARFHQVERDMFDVSETLIELPTWIGNG